MPALMIVLGALVAFILWQQTGAQDQQAAAQIKQKQEIGRLNKTDLISCSFLVADATTRVKQAANATKSSDKTQRFIVKTQAFVAQLDAAAAKAPPSKRGSLAPFRAYLVAQIDVSQAQLNSTRKNIVLTRALAAKAQQLALQLHC